MRIVRSFTIAAAVLALSGSAFAAQAKPAKTADAKAAKPTMITASGTVSKFDAGSNTLTVTTPKGDVSFNVAGSASILANGKKVAASDLSNQVGHKVSVRYTEAGGTKTAESIRVSSSAKTASTKKTTTAKS